MFHCVLYLEADCHYSWLTVEDVTQDYMYLILYVDTETDEHDCMMMKNNVLMLFHETK